MLLQNAKSSSEEYLPYTVEQNSSSCSGKHRRQGWGCVWILTRDVGSLCLCDCRCLSAFLCNSVMFFSCNFFIFLLSCQYVSTALIYLLFLNLWIYIYIFLLYFYLRLFFLYFPHVLSFYSLSLRSYLERMESNIIPTYWIPFPKCGVVFHTSTGGYGIGFEIFKSVWYAAVWTIISVQR